MLDEDPAKREAWSAESKSIWMEKGFLNLSPFKCSLSQEVKKKKCAL